MMAALSPAADNYEETLSTLQFAERVKKIKVDAEANVEVTKEGLLREKKLLEKEIQELRQALEASDGVKTSDGIATMAFVHPLDAAFGIQLNVYTVEQVRDAAQRVAQSVVGAERQAIEEVLGLVDSNLERQLHGAQAAGQISRVDAQQIVAHVLRAKPQTVRAAYKNVAEQQDNVLRTLPQSQALKLGQQLLRKVPQLSEGSAQLKAALLSIEERLPKGEDEPVSEVEWSRAAEAALVTGLHEAGEAERTSAREALLKATTGAWDDAVDDVGELMGHELLLALLDQSAAMISESTTRAALLEQASLEAEKCFDAVMLCGKTQTVTEWTLHDAMRLVVRRLSVQMGVQAEQLQAQVETSLAAQQQHLTSAQARTLVANAAAEEMKERLVAHEGELDQLQKSHHDRLNETRREIEAATAALKRLVGGDAVDAVNMRSTPSLRNLSEDPLMDDQLVYFLTPGDTTLGSPEGATHSREEPSGTKGKSPTRDARGSIRQLPVQEGTAARFIQLSGLGMEARHAQLSFVDGSKKIDITSRQSARVQHEKQERRVVFRALDGECHINGTLLERGEEKELHHNDRIIMGATQVFRFNDPLEARAAGDEVMDWQAAMDERFHSREEQLQRDEAAVREEREELDKALKQTVAKKEKREALEAQAAEHQVRWDAALGGELKAQAIRLMRLVDQANSLARKVGRSVSFEPRLAVHVPADKSISPSEALLLYREPKLQVVGTVHGQGSGKRDFVWSGLEFEETCFPAMVNAATNPGTVTKAGSTGDPFCAPLAPTLVGCAYLHLAPLAHRTSISPSLNLKVISPNGIPVGTLRVGLTLPDGMDALPEPTAADFVDGLAFSISIEEAKLKPEKRQDVFVRYALDAELVRMTGAVATDVTSREQGIVTEDRTTCSLTWDFETAHLKVKEVTSELVTHLLTHTVRFEVYCTPVDVTELAKPKQLRQTAPRWEELTKRANSEVRQLIRELLQEQSFQLSALSKKLRDSKADADGEAGGLKRIDSVSDRLKVHMGLDAQQRAVEEMGSLQRTTSEWGSFQGGSALEPSQQGHDERLEEVREEAREEALDAATDWLDAQFKAKAASRELKRAERALKQAREDKRGVDDLLAKGGYDGLVDAAIAHEAHKDATDAARRRIEAAEAEVERVKAAANRAQEAADRLVEAQETAEPQETLGDLDVGDENTGVSLALQRLEARVQQMIDEKAAEAAAEARQQARKAMLPESVEREKVADSTAAAHAERAEAADRAREEAERKLLERDQELRALRASGSGGGGGSGGGRRNGGGGGGGGGDGDGVGGQAAELRQVYQGQRLQMYQCMVRRMKELQTTALEELNKQQAFNQAHSNATDNKLRRLEDESKKALDLQQQTRAEAHAHAEQLRRELGAMQASVEQLKGLQSDQARQGDGIETGPNQTKLQDDVAQILQKLNKLQPSIQSALPSAPQYRVQTKKSGCLVM